MNEPNILYPAIFVFSMLLVGLFLTIWEFSRLKKSAGGGVQGERAANRGPGDLDDRFKKASGF